jgi:hypothetical protein
LGLLLAVSSWARAAGTLPPAQGADLNGRPVALPAALSGSASILVVGFDKASGDACQEWGKRLWTRHGPASPIFLLLQLGGVPGFILPFIRAGVRSKTPDFLYGRVFLLRQSAEAWKRSLAYDPSAAPDDPYLAVAGAGDALIWKGHGAFSEALSAELEDAFLSTSQKRGAEAVAP